MKKRIISVVIAAILCFAMILPATVSAFDGSKPHWKASAEVTGRKLTLTVKSVNCAGKLAGGDLCLKYDPEVLKFVKIVKNSKTLDGLSVPNGTYPIGDNGEDGTGIFANLANAFNNEEDGILYVAEFEILDGKTCGETPFTVTHVLMTTVEEDGSLASLVDETWNIAPIDFKCDHAEKTTTTVPATCQADGKEVISCAACGEVIKETPIAKGPHDFSVKVSETPATCTDAGKIVWKCSACDETKEETIAALGHEWDDGVVTTDPTCLDKGVKTFTCKRCQATKTEEVAALGHEWVKDEEQSTEPDCKEKTNGELVERCTRCQITKTTELKWEDSHVWDEGKVTKEATVDAEGEKTFTCTKCGETKVETIAKLAPADNGSNSNTENNATSPKTGDSTQVVLFSVVAVISLAALAVIVYRNKVAE